MRFKPHVLILSGALLIGSLSGCEQQSRISSDHHQAHYVSWGVDEFEIFGLTKEELTKKFRGTLHLGEKDDLAAIFDDGRPGHFHLSFDENNRICDVQRVFIDGAGCEIFGPFLTSKRQALEFSINGLTEAGHLDKDDSLKLKTAREILDKEMNSQTER